MAVADAMQVATVLSQTLEPDAQTRRKAEADLKQMEQMPGLGVVLMQLTISDQSPPPIRLAAAVAMKNFVKENWNKEKCEVEISDEERKQLRIVALECMFIAAGNIRKQLSQVVCIMGSHDFPGSWPELIDVLAGHLSGADLDKLMATLSTMDELFRHYRHEMKSNKLWSELAYVLQHVAAPLTELFTKMVVYIEQKDSMPLDQCVVWLTVLLLIAENFHSLNSQDLPEYFEDHLGVWMNAFLELLKLKVAALDAQADDSEASVLDKLKCSICEIVTLYSQRYEEEVMPYMQGMIEVIWQLLVETDNRGRYDALVNAALGFLSSICTRPHYSMMFEADGVLKTICEDVIVKNLMLRKCDIEQFDDEPNEYIKRDIEGSDIDTRRRGASDFVRALCRRFEGPVTGILSNVITSFLEECARDLSASWLKKDVIYCLVTAIATKTETARFGATSTSDLVNIVDFYQTHVRCDLFDEDVNRLAILKADSLKYVVTFRNQLTAQQLIEVVGATPKLLSSAHAILHHYVAYALERIMLVRDKATNQVLISRENVQSGPLIAALFHAFDTTPGAQNSHYLMKAIMRCFNIIDAETAKSSGELVNKLAVMIASAVKNPVDPLHIHFVFESLCILIRQVYTVVEGGIDKHIIPLIENILANDVVDFVPYALQITALLLDQAQTKAKEGLPLVDSYLPFFSFLMKEELWLRSANIPAALLVIESFMRCHSGYILENHAAVLLAIFQRLIGSKALDQYGFQLASTLVLFTDKTDKITDASLWTPMLRRVQFTKTTKFIKQFVLFLARFAIVRSGAALYQALESIQTGMYQMVIEKVLIVELNGMHNTTTFDEKRYCCIGVANLIAETVDKLGQHYGALVEAVVRLVEASGCGPTPLSEDADAESAYATVDVEYNDPYCKLTYAQHQDNIAADISNFKAYLAQAVMVRATAIRPDSGVCINEQVRTILTGYAQA
uniref:Exportin-2 n=1 Tax=Ascaris suum TaxID=6253 RepID=F1KQX7_ASCSU